MEQVEQLQSSQTSTSERTFRDYVDFALIFGCIPALILNVIFWAVATAFPKAGVLPNIMALLITLLLAFIGIIMLVRYVDICALNARGTSSDENLLTVGSGAVCLFLAVSIVVCLSTAGTLEGWHYTLMTALVLLVGYQTWRVFLGN